MALDRDGLEVVPRGDCLDLLATRTVGRVGLSCQAPPTILPVTYRLVDEDIIYASGTGAKSLAATHEQVVAFEADNADVDGRDGWSVVAVGIPQELDADDPRAVQARQLGLAPWIGAGAR